MSAGRIPHRPKKKGCKHTYDPVRTEFFDPATASSALFQAWKAVEAMKLNLKNYGQLEAPTSKPNPKSAPEQDPVNYNEQVEAAISKIMNTSDWKGGCALQALLDTHAAEYERKWGPNGVFVRLAELYPEREVEVENDRWRHQEVFHMYRHFTDECRELRVEGDVRTLFGGKKKSKRAIIA